jgi:hypothetical protein
MTTPRETEPVAFNKSSLHPHKRSSFTHFDSAKISVDLSFAFTRLPASQVLMNSVIANLNPMPKRAAWLRKVAMGHSVGGGRSNH